MKVKEEVRSHFLNLMNNSDYAKCHFYKLKIENYNYENYINLRNKVDELELKEKVIISLTKLSYLLKANHFYEKIQLKNKSNHSLLMMSMHNLNIFEASLAYLLISNHLDLDKCHELGYKDKYILDLISRYKQELDIGYDETNILVYSKKNTN